MEKDQVKKIISKISNEFQLVQCEELVLQKNNFTNTIYSVGDKYIIRICSMKSNEKNFIKASNFCMKYAKELNTPQILYSQLCDNETGFCFTLMEKIQGNLLSEVWPSLKREKKTEIVTQIANSMKEIHQIDDLIFADTLQDKNAWKNKFWDDITKKLDMLLRQNVVDAKFWSLIVGFVEKNISCLEEVDFAICHSDLHFDNIMVNNEGQIVILDYDRLRKASVDYELDAINRMCYMPQSVLHLNGLSDIDASNYFDFDILEMLKENYPRLFCFDNMECRLKIYGLKQYINVLARMATKKLQDEIVEFISK